MDRRDFLKASGWTLLGLAAAGTIPGCAKLGDKDSLPDKLKKGFPSLKDLKVFWGDLHNHCNVTYGHGDLSDALAAAGQQLDFVSVTPHALWPDIPGETTRASTGSSATTPRLSNACAPEVTTNTSRPSRRPTAPASS